jgi:tetratricopeptide (TPR) repeat protein
MRTTDLGEAFKMIMVDRGWSQTRLGRELDKDQTWVSRVIGGHRDLRTRDASKLLAKVGWELHITPKSDVGVAEDDPVKRREFLAAATSATFIRSPRTTPFHDPAFVSELTQRTVQAKYQIGGNSLAANFTRYARKISSVSDSGGPTFHSAASDFMRQGAYLLRQAGRPDIATRFANSAIRYARQARNPDKQAWAYCTLILSTTFNGRKGTMSTANGDGSRAVILAQKGLRIDSIGDEPRAYLNACLACGLANVPGNERNARAALDKALSIDRLSAIDQADIIDMVGNALRDMGEHQEASKMFTDAIRQSSSIGQFIQAIYLCDQTINALEMRQPELASELMDDLSYMIPLIDSTMVTRLTNEILRATKPWEAIPEVRHARERVQSVRLTNEDPK